MALVNQAYTFTLHPEKFRFFAYVAFWLMVIVAIFVTKNFVKPDPHTYENEVRKLSGYDNICVNWDYEPALSIAAIMYVFVELPLLIYIVLEWYRACIASTDHIIELWEFKFITVCLGFSFFFVCLFRMIFVIHATDNVIGHTLGFIGLQLALMFNAMSSFLFYSRTVFEHPFLTWGGFQWAGVIYLTLLGFFTVAKLTITICIMTHHPIWPIPSPDAKYYGQVADNGWMLFAAFCPLFISSFLWCKTQPITITMNWAPNAEGFAAVPDNEGHDA